MTVTADDEIAAELSAALAQDAGTPAPAGEVTAPAPPVKPEQPARPAPKPRPARPKGDDKPRTAPVAEVGPPLPAGKYAAGLTAFGEQVWLVASLNKGVKLGPVGLPDTRPYAAAFRQQLPALARTWGVAATQNATVRKYVSKIAGDGGGSWVVGVAISSAMFAMGCAQLARAENAALREQLAAQNDQAVEAYMQQMAEALGLTEEAQE